jgi:PhzF family phenazine biosynthesis protein
MRFQIVDAFADAWHAGNPAAVVIAPIFPADGAMQAAAHQIGLPTTAFVVPMAPGEYRVRWFTPHKEINLCGHATIASARCLFGQGGHGKLRFLSDNGVLCAERVGDLIAIDLPASTLTPCDAPSPGLLAALGLRGPLATDVVSVHVSHDDVLVEVASSAVVEAVRPDFAVLARQPFRGHIVTAQGSGKADFVSRTFFPSLGVNEDQVCVTAHCKLTPFWARKLERDRMIALQLSQRGGRLQVEKAGDRVRVLGTAVPREGNRELVPEQYDACSPRRV